MARPSVCTASSGWLFRICSRAWSVTRSDAASAGDDECDISDSSDVVADLPLGLNRSDFERSDIGGRSRRRRLRLCFRAGLRRGGSCLPGQRPWFLGRRGRRRCGLRLGARRSLTWSSLAWSSRGCGRRRRHVRGGKIVLAEKRERDWAVGARRLASASRLSARMPDRAQSRPSALAMKAAATSIVRIEIRVGNTRRQVIVDRDRTRL